MGIGISESRTLWPLVQPQTAVARGSWLISAATTRFSTPSEGDLRGAPKLNALWRVTGAWERAWTPQLIGIGDVFGVWANFWRAAGG